MTRNAHVFAATSFLAAPLLLGACQSAPETDSAPSTEPAKKTSSTQSDYVFVWLKTGPHSAEHTAEDRQTIFKGHMANMERLAAEHKLIIAGPFDAGRHDKEDRGIFVFDVPTVAEARALVETDPGVKSGEFRYELCPMRSTPDLRKTIAFEAEAKAQAAREGREYGMKDMRMYELVMMADMDAALSALPSIEDPAKVLFTGRFGGDCDGRGVMLVDATDAHGAAAALGPVLKSAGETWIDPWYSTKSLQGLVSPRGTR